MSSIDKNKNNSVGYTPDDIVATSQVDQDPEMNEARTAPTDDGQSGDVSGRAVDVDNENRGKEIGGPKGLEPTRYGDWERKGRCVDF
ncbi:MAG: hypothetical protein DHS20C01_16680 [marine bacterium B5-7]|nr:MAG: hypothetical protein DHS20C01_16680 [marine bacterium B5-7]